MLNAKGVLLHTTYNLLKASFWLVCSLEQGNVNKRSGNQTKTRLKVLWSKSSSKYPSKKIRPKNSSKIPNCKKIPQQFVKKFIKKIRPKISSRIHEKKNLSKKFAKKICPNIPQNPLSNSSIKNKDTPSNTKYTKIKKVNGFHFF